MAEILRRLKAAEDALEEAQKLCVEADSFISHMLYRNSWPESDYEVERLIGRLRGFARSPNPK